MSLRERFNRLPGGKKKAAPEAGANLSAGSDCPHEADVVAYLQNRLSPRQGRQLEKHLAGCDNCREALTHLARLPDAEAGDASITSAHLTEDEVKNQARKVLGLIQDAALNDESRPRFLKRQSRVARNDKGFYLSYPKLAAAMLIFCAVAAGAVFWLTSGPSAEESATGALQAAMQNERRTIARISGNLPHSEWSMEIRGKVQSDEFQLERALARLRFAQEQSAPAESRHLLARVHLAFGKTDNARQAQAILEQLRVSGQQSAEVFNDLGVAQFQLGDYARAIESFSNALAISPKLGEALFNRALANERAGDFDKAQKDWQDFISDASDDQWKVEAERKLKSLQNTPGK